MSRRKKTTEEHTHLAIRVEGFDARAEAGLHIDLLSSRPVFATKDDLVFPASTKLILRGRSTYPEERAGDAYEITLWGEKSGRAKLTLKDIHVHDDHHVPLYRKYRDEEVPVYEVPSGLATLERRRADRVWQAWITDEPRLVSDMLLLLRLERPLFLAMHEMKVERRRWIRSISLQTTDPSQE
jgi:hypothetical protein